MTTLVWLVIALPLAGAAILLLTGRRSNSWGHLLGCLAALASFGASSKMNNHPDFLRHLHHLGECAAERWLAENRENVGIRSTVDLSGLVPTRHAPLTSPSLSRKAQPQKHKVHT